MATEIKMPKLGLTMESGNVVEWAKAEKDKVEKGEIILIIESDKVTYELESPGSGLLLILIEKGEEIPVGQLLGYLAESEAEYNDLKEKSVGESTRLETEKEPEPRESEAEKKAPTPAPEREGRIRATPSARRLAQEKGIDISSVSGTGPQGRIQKEDVLSFVEASASTPEISKEEAGKFKKKRLLKEETMSSMRATIASRMIKSLQDSAQMTAFSEWDVTELMNLRSVINKSEEKYNFRATIPGLIIPILARVLKEMPIFNASVEKNKIKYWSDINIGLAVAIPEGLVVPVIHSAGAKSLVEIHEIMADLIERARKKKLLPDDMAQGTFTLTNLGSYGGDWETIILNPPESAILGIGQITQKPVVVKDRIEVRYLMPVSVTVDHRIIDGATSGAFRDRMKELVENPGLMWLEMDRSRERRI